MRPLVFQEGLWGDIWGKAGQKLIRSMTQFMINYHIKLLSTHDLRLKKAMSDKSFKSRAILNLIFTGLILTKKRKLCYNQLKLCANIERDSRLRGNDSASQGMK